MTRPTLIVPPPDVGDDERGGPPRTWAEEDVVASARAAPGGMGTTVLPVADPDGPRAPLRHEPRARFVRLGLLGEGGLGEVIAAEDQDIGRKVAIKRIRADRTSDAVLRRFLQEIRTVGHLEHANIVPIHDVGRDEAGALFFVMRHVDGETLEQIIARLRAGDAEYHRRFGFERRVRIIAGVLEALSYAHAQGVVHRDIKPANIMVGRYGEVFLLDWGIARRLDRPDLAPDGEAAAGSLFQTRAGAVLGTPPYMAPEQARGEPVDARADLYAVSVVLHELLTLTHYLDDLSQEDDLDALLAAVSARPVPLAAMVRSEHQDPVPMDLSWFVHQGVQKDRERRYASADAMLERLARRAEGEVPVQCHVTFARRMTLGALHAVDRHVMAFAGALMVTALAATGFAGAAVASWAGLLP